MFQQLSAEAAFSVLIGATHTTKANAAPTETLVRTEAQVLDVGGDCRRGKNPGPCRDSQIRAITSNLLLRRRLRILRTAGWAITRSWTDGFYID
jgi:hypothetical protein